MGRTSEGGHLALSFVIDGHGGTALGSMSGKATVDASRYNAPFAINNGDSNLPKLSFVD
jgi:serine/threonine protein phosphatase PrpC